MNGSPVKLGTISGTASHSSALKMKMEKDAAAKMKKDAAAKMKKESPVYFNEELKKASAEGKLSGKFKEAVDASPNKFIPGLASGVAAYTMYKAKKSKKRGDSKKSTNTKDTKTNKSTKKKTSTKKYSTNMKDFKIGSKERYDEYKRRGWAQDDTTKGYKPKSESGTDSKPKYLKETKEKISKIKAKSNKKMGEVVENVIRKETKEKKTSARKTYGRGSKEHLEAKLAHSQAKQADYEGAKGGKKRKFFGKWASKYQQRKQEKLKAKLAEKE